MDEDSTYVPGERVRGAQLQSLGDDSRAVDSLAGLEFDDHHRHRFASAVPDTDQSGAKDLGMLVDDGFAGDGEHPPPSGLQTFVEICRDAVASWKEDGTPMIVLLSGTKAPKGVSKLKAGSAED